MPYSKEILSRARARLAQARQEQQDTYEAHLQEAYARLMKIKPSAETTPSLLGEGRGEASLRQRCVDAMDDDLNTPFVIAALFDSTRAINTIYDG